MASCSPRSPGMLGIGAFSAVGCGIVLLALTFSQGQPQMVRIGSVKQLFLDGRVIEKSENVQRQFHPPVRYGGNPVIAADKPWERGLSGVSVCGGSVLYDEEDKLFKMWYRTDAPWRGAAGHAYHYYSCYATSKDGLVWERPNLGFVEHNGSRENNILPPGKGGSGFVRRPNLIKDYEEPDPEKRYKMVYMDQMDGKWVLAKAYSHDGIKWRMNIGQPTYFAPPLWPNGDLFGWDSKARQFVLFQHKTSGYVRADVDGRTVRIMEALSCSTSNDFETWADTHDVIKRDDRLDPPRWEPGHVGVLAAVLYTGDLYVGFLDTCTTYYAEDVARFSSSGSALPEKEWEGVYRSEHAEHRSELVISRDRKDWKRVAPHMGFPRPGAWMTWDQDHVTPAKPIVRNGEILVYYSGSDFPCKGYMPDHPLRKQIKAVDGAFRGGYGIGLAKLRLDGFASMDGYEPEGVLLTHPLAFEGDRLVVNVRAPERPVTKDDTRVTPYGRMLVEILDVSGRPLDGFRAADCDPIGGDQLRRTVTWKGRASLASLSKQPIKLRFKLRNAALYSFQFVRDGAEEGSDLACPGCRGFPK